MATHDQLLWADRQPVTNARRSDRLTWKWCYEDGYRPPNYPVPATLDRPNSLISWLWVYMPRTKRNRKMLNQWFVTLCFDKRGLYIG